MKEWTWDRIIRIQWVGYTFAAIVILGIAGIAILYALGSQKQWDMQEAQTRQLDAQHRAWAAKHCRRVGYTARSEELFSCDDGIVYMLRDMPTADTI